MREWRTRLQDWSHWGKSKCGLCCWEKGDQANICSIHLYEDFVELDNGDNNGDNIDTSILILNDNGDGGLTGLGWKYPWLLPGKFMEGGGAEILLIVIKFYEERILARRPG